MSGRSRGDWNVAQQDCSGSRCIAQANYIEKEQKILAGDLCGTVCAVETATGKPGRQFPPCYVHLLSMAVSPDQELVAFTDWTNCIHVYSLKTFEKLASLKGHAKAVSTIRFSETEPWLYSGGYDGIVRIWDLQSFAEIAGYQGSQPVNVED